MTSPCRSCCCRGHGDVVFAASRVRHTGGVTGWGVDEEARTDVVGTASARLLAAGLGRPDRTGALRLLGLLGASADADGIVRRPLDDLAAEFDLPPGEAGHWLAALIGVGIVRRGIGVLVLAGVEPPAAGGLRLADFLATAAAMDDDASLDAPPTPVRRLPAYPRRTLSALAAVAAVAVLAAIVPVFGGGGAPADRTAAVSTERPDVTQAAPTSTVDRPTTTVAPDAPLPVVVPTTTTTVVADCPVGEPVLDVLGIAEGAADGLASVEGTATNPGDGDLVLGAFTVVVDVAGERVEVPGLTRPLAVAAGETVRWAVESPAVAVPGMAARATVDDWHWVDRACR